jgi:hypothetical protein
MTNGPYFSTQASRRARWQEFVLIKMISSYRKPQVMPTRFGIERPYAQMGSCHGPAGGAPAAGTGGGGTDRAHPAGYAPPLARRREIATKTQKLRPISNCDALPNHVLPLTRFGAPPTYVAAAWCGPNHHDAGKRSGSTQQHDPKVQHASVGGC